MLLLRFLINLNLKIQPRTPRTGLSNGPPMKYQIRMNNGKKVPPPLQRFRADDLLTAVFPKLTGCPEPITGDHEIPDHPLVRQTMEDCLREAMDIEGLQDVLSAVQSGEISFVPRDTREPSPFSYELLNSNPYAFLDGGELQDRRARAVSTRR